MFFPQPRGEFQKNFPTDVGFVFAENTDFLDGVHSRIRVDG